MYNNAVAESLGFFTCICIHCVAALAQAVGRLTLAMASFDKVCEPFVRIGLKPAVLLPQEALLPLYAVHAVSEKQPIVTFAIALGPPLTVKGQTRVAPKLCSMT